MSEPYLKEVTFEEMLKSDEMIVCDCWLLKNSIHQRYGVNFSQPMLFSEFLGLIGKYFTSMNCKSIFQQAKWYV